MSSSIKEEDYHHHNDGATKTAGITSGITMMEEEEIEDNNNNWEASEAMASTTTISSLVLTLLEIDPKNVAYGAYQANALPELTNYSKELIEWADQIWEMRQEFFQRHRQNQRQHQKGRKRRQQQKSNNNNRGGEEFTTTTTTTKSEPEMEGNVLKRRKSNHYTNHHHHYGGGEFSDMVISSNLKNNYKSAGAVNHAAAGGGAGGGGGAKDEESIEKSPTDIVTSANKSGVTGATTVTDEFNIKKEQQQQQDEEEESALIINHDHIMGQEQQDHHHHQQDPTPLNNHDSSMMVEEKKKNDNYQQQEKESNEETEGDVHHQTQIVEENTTKDIIGEEEATTKLQSILEDDGNNMTAQANKAAKENVTKNFPMEMMATNHPLVAAAQGENGINFKKKKKLSTKQDYRQYKSVACSNYALAEHVTGKPIDPNEPRKTRLAAGAKRHDYTSAVNTSTTDIAATEKPLECGTRQTPEEMQRQQHLMTTMTIVVNGKVVAPQGGGDTASADVGKDQTIINNPTTGQQQQITLGVAGLEAFNGAHHHQSCPNNSVVVVQTDALTNTAEKKKKRGRPRKNQCHTSSMIPVPPPGVVDQKKKKKKRGRPRKIQCPSTSSMVLPMPAGKDSVPPRLQKHFDHFEDGNPVYKCCGVCEGVHHHDCNAYWIQCGNCASWYHSAPLCLGFSAVEADSVDWHCMECYAPDENVCSNEIDDGDYCCDGDFGGMTKKKKKGRTTTIKTPSNNPTTIKAKSTTTSQRGRPRKDPAAPKGPCSSYALFNAEMRPKMSKESPGTPFKDMSLKIAEHWRKLPQEEKNRFEDAAAADKLRYKKEMDQYKASKNGAASTSTPTAQEAVAIAPGGVPGNGSVAVASSTGGTEDAIHVVATATNNNKFGSAESPTVVTATNNNKSSAAEAKSKTNDMAVKAGPAAFVLMELSDSTTAKSCNNPTEAESNGIHGSVTGNVSKGSNNKRSSSSTTTTAPVNSPAVYVFSPTHIQKSPSNTTGPLNEEPGVPPEVSTTNPYLPSPRNDASAKPSSEGTPGPKAVAETSKVRSPSTKYTRRVTIDLSNLTDSEDEED